MRIYEYDNQGNYTRNWRDITQFEGIPNRWTEVQLPTIPEGKFAVFNGDSWLIVDEPIQQKIIPGSVTNYQAKAALQQAGLLQASQQLVDQQTDELIKIAWESAEFFRDSSMVETMGFALGLTEEDIDNLFIAAAKIFD